MSEDEAEYVVEYIVRAKVAGSKRGKKHWLYYVKWKDYSFEDNTWEPVESFAGGSEHFVESFWDRVDTNGRNYHDLSQFSLDEELFPSGPPRRKKAKKAKEEARIPSPPVEISDSENEVRSIINDEEEAEEEVTTSRRKRRRSSAANQANDNPSPPKRKRERPPGTRPEELKQQEEVVNDNKSPPKRKKGRPPGKRRDELDQEEAAKLLTRKKSVPELPRTNRGRQAVVAESSTTPARRLSLPRRRGRPPPNPQPSTSSPDEIDILPDTNEKPPSSRAKKSMPEVLLETSHGGRALPPSGSSREAQDHAAMDIDEFEDEPPMFGDPVLLSPQPAPEEPASEKATLVVMPHHRSRAANPRVQLLDDPNLADANGAISVKARFMRRANATSGDSDVERPVSGPSRVAKGKAGPGRSSSGLVVGGSRLVAQKGKLTTIKANAAAMSIKASDGTPSPERNGSGVFGDTFRNAAELDEVPGLGQFESGSPDVHAPSGKELLKEAGLDVAVAEGLPDFEEDAEGEDDLEYIHNPQREQRAADVARQHEAALQPEEPVPMSEETGDSPEAPSISLVAKPLTFASRVTSAFSQSTIFGPLTLGTSPQRKQLQDNTVDSSSAPKQHVFNLNLDAAVSIPVTLQDVHGPASFVENLDSTARNPTGKFYKDQFAFALLNSLRPQGSYARISLSEGAAEDEKKHLARFAERLRSGELFIQMNRFEPLVVCDSENSALAQKLAVPAALLGRHDSVVVVHVSIEDHSAYAEAALHADNSRW
ncbi:hypothetical protein PYCCODRAFT_1419963 [Trametes coccinea BRFM310]|uniref:Chromo domain-containing protein n=1 Tax=Trametes coccinea (strain BRFM310) TaxID=1353009 RepID=A0A1Y2I9H4_TRAC3|nr:hypothetical protein PYCCODRAFT_1419963 [Trametes coccinea BRFM310]